ncbi:hypothetical protein [Spiroplasma ixodetis]|uniref:Uncharacterized protein n=1 Tax=Spiroplasma ixodetis TaxID=2141 RepID=A0ABN6T750_9MOLU|nr:hypothetical protein [Spiroplasma ixodetis]BDT05132.1 hypothetical protein SHM_27780 [Spiroplasma ixodetis]
MIKLDIKNKEKMKEYAQKPEVKARKQKYEQKSEVKAKRKIYNQKWYQKRKKTKQELQFNNNYQKEVMVNAINKLADEYPATAHVLSENQKIWKSYL